MWLGRQPFNETAHLQERIRAGILAGTASQTLLLCEHDPVVTMGRSARKEHVLLSDADLARQGVALVHASRGGGVTYHGPGQLVGYPIFHVRAGVVAHVRAMADGIIDVLDAMGVAGQWRREQPGVWVAGEKICAFGVHISRRVAIHGFALNVNTDLRAFDAIIPCGLRGAHATSIRNLTGAEFPVERLARAVADAFAKSFKLELQSEIQDR